MLTILLLICAGFVLSGVTGQMGEEGHSLSLKMDREKDLRGVEVQEGGLVGEAQVQEGVVEERLEEEVEEEVAEEVGVKVEQEGLVGETQVQEEMEEERLEEEETGEVRVSDGADSRSSCPSGWTRYGSRCYLFVRSARTWAAAERYCVHFGANLASVHSSLEYHFLQEVVIRETSDFSPVWLGGSDAVENLVWFWSDGSRFDYQNWARTEPNNEGGDEECMVMNAGGEYRWNDIKCGNHYYFICSYSSVNCSS
ncbi:ladderlectin-like [Osmerus eperlanus]|uniref:ladderlectin-like n=1 Tax=Osmerus eperlanus TaxID=29151 RepID=UPI002E132C2E